MLTEASTYDELYRNFRWDIPERFNMATACCDRHADGTGRLALVYVDEDGGTTRTSFDEVAEHVAPFRQCAEGRRAVARRPRRGVPVAIAGIADRASRGVSLRHDLDSAVCAVRRGRAGIPPVEFRGQGHRHRRERLGEACENPRPSSRAEERLRDRRWHASRHEIVLVVAQGGIAGFRDRRYLGRRSRPDHLHLGHDRKSKRRAARPSRRARPSAQCRDVPQLSAQAPAT